MNLKKLVLKKIKELGPTKAAAYFGVSVPTIYSWRKKKGDAPIDAVQKVLNELPDDKPTQVPDDAPPPPPEAEVAPDVVTGEQAVGELSLENHEYRIQKLEMAVATRYDAARARRAPSLVNPLSPPNSGMEIKTRPEIIGEQPKAQDAPQHWNDPKPQSGESGWNAPIKKAPPGGSRAENWNAPLAQKIEQPA